EEKDFIALTLLLAAPCAAVLIACISQRVRDLFFFLLVTLSAVTERVDINFVSRDWYRGTTRGFEVSLVDVVSISLLIACFHFPRADGQRAYWPTALCRVLMYV